MKKRNVLLPLFIVLLLFTSTTMRNYNFITANVFLGAGFVVALDPNKGISKFAYIIAALGFLWALLQVVYGKMQASATNLWRKQAWIAEATLKTKFDSTLFELYQCGETRTPFGTIEMASKKKWLPHTPVRYRLPFLLGLYVSLGVTIPWMMAAFWLALTCVMLQSHKVLWDVTSLVALGVMVILLLLSLCFRTAYPHSMLHKHIAASQLHKGS